MQATQFELLNTRNFSAGHYHTAIVPIASCKSHGDHLPFGMDALSAHALALHVGAKVPGSMVQLPTFFGMSHHYRHQPMTISLSSATTTALFRDIFESLALAGVGWWVPVGQLCPPELFEVGSGWGHGGEAETSMGLELFSQWVDMAHAGGAIAKVGNIIKEIWLFEELTPVGATGAPGKATVEKGRCITDTVVNYIADYLVAQHANVHGYDPEPA